MNSTFCRALFIGEQYCRILRQILGQIVGHLLAYNLGYCSLYCSMLNVCREEPRVVHTCDNFIRDSVEVEVHAPRVVDKGKAKMLDDELVVKRRKATVKNKGIVIEENKNPTFINDTSSDSDSEPMFNNVYSGSDSESSYSDKSIDYLSKGEDEVIELRKRKNEAMRAPKQLNMKTPTDDVDHIGCFRPKSVFDIHEAHHVLEHECFMNELLRKLKDGDNGITDPFRLVEDKVGERFVDAEQLKECMTYYALANGFSPWFYRSSKDKVRVMHLNAHGDVMSSVCPPKNLFRSYGKALLEPNVGSTVKLRVTVNPDEKTYFDRFYACLNGLKQG
ncbi:hypothetical protein Tco_0928897 [Tanacetum coccineum]